MLIVIANMFNATSRWTNEISDRDAKVFSKVAGACEDECDKKLIWDLNEISKYQVKNFMGVSSVGFVQIAFEILYDCLRAYIVMLINAGVLLGEKKVFFEIWSL